MIPNHPPFFVLLSFSCIYVCCGSMCSMGSVWAQQSYNAVLHLHLWLWPDLPNFGNLGLFWALLGSSDGNVVMEKWFQTIGPGVPSLDPTLIHLDPAIWGPQGRLWPNLPNLWQFGAIFGHKYYPKCWKSVGSHWITILHHQTDQKNAKVVSK